MKTTMLDEGEKYILLTYDARYTTDRRQRMRTGTRRRWGVPIVAMLLLLGLASGPASADVVDTLVSGLASPHAVAVGPDGTIYYSDMSQFRIFQIHPVTGVDLDAGG